MAADVLLTTREKQIVQVLADGATAWEVATRLGIRWHTARTHIRNIYLKAGVSNRVELVRWASAFSNDG